jgi:hypothetical protein
MSITRHAPDPLHVRETLCGTALAKVGTELELVAAIGESINCPECRTVINMATKCIGPKQFMLVRAP